mgnify:FL=1
MHYPNTILDLIQCFKKYPSIGEKTAERLALYTLNLDDSIIELMANSLNNIKTKIKKCKICNNYTEDDICYICNSNRDSKLLCIVESAKDINLLEKNNIYNGYYFVLDNLISPSNGLDPSVINFERII